MIFLGEGSVKRDKAEDFGTEKEGILRGKSGDAPHYG